MFGRIVRTSKTNSPFSHMTNPLSIVRKEISDAFAHIWKKLDIVHPREAMAIGNGVIGSLLFIVGYESRSSIGLDVLPEQIPWQYFPSLLIFCMYVLANPVRKPTEHALATTPLIAYGILLMAQVLTGRLTLDGALPATFSFFFALLGLLVVRRYYAEDLKDQEIARLAEKLAKAEYLVRNLPSSELTPLRQALHESSPNNPTND